MLSKGLIKIYDLNVYLIHTVPTFTVASLIVLSGSQIIHITIFKLYRDSSAPRAYIQDLRVREYDYRAYASLNTSMLTTSSPETIVNVHNNHFMPHPVLFLSQTSLNINNLTVTFHIEWRLILVLGEIYYKKMENLS